MKDIISVHPISGIEFLTLLDFLSVESNKGVFCYVNKVTFRKHLGGGWLSGEPTNWITGLELSVSPP